MKRTLIAFNIAALFLIFSAAAIAVSPDFSGTWTLDKAKSKNLSPDMNQVMTVTQSGDKITLKTKLTTDQGEADTSDSFDLSGKEFEFTTVLTESATTSSAGSEETLNKRSTGKSKRTVKRTTDGIEVKESLIYPSRNGEVTVQITRKWMLSSDGKTLRIDITAQSPSGTHRTEQVFNKK